MSGQLIWLELFSRFLLGKDFGPTILVVGNSSLKKV